MPVRFRNPDGTRNEEPFVLTGMVSLVLASVWLFIKRAYLLEYFYFSQLLALTHLYTLGFLSSLMMGVLYRLSPKILGVEPGSVRIGVVQFVFFVVGILGMVSHFWMGESKGMSWSTFLVFAAGLLQIWNFRGLFRVRGKNAWPSRFVASALVYFLLAAILGILLGLVKGYSVRVPILSDEYIDNVFAHAHLAGLGWVTMMIFGIHLKLVPTTVGSERWLGLRFALMHVGILGVAASFLLDWDAAPFAVVLAAACAWHTMGPLAAWVRGRAFEWEILPLLLLVASAVMGLMLSLDVPDPTSAARGPVQLAYGFVAVVGFMVLTVVTVAFKLFPMWVWQERFQNDFGTRPVPGMKDLHSETLRVVANTGLFVGVSLAAAAICGGSEALLTPAVGMVLAAVLAFAFNFVRVARWGLLNLKYEPTESDRRKYERMFPEDSKRR